MDYTRRIAEFVVGAGSDTMPAGALGSAQLAILDAVGVALAGSQEAAGRIAAEITRDESARSEAALFGHGFKSSPTMAAFANGVAVHALDFDASFSIMGQPMAGLVPTVFALAEPRAASGRQLLEAYVVGFEVSAKLAWSMPLAWREGGWHAVSVIGSVGCAAAAARLSGLDVGQTCRALGIASSMAGGSVGNFGTMSKPLHAGLAARNGVSAAALAAKGFTANEHMLDGRGFHATFAPGMEPQLGRFDELGSVWDVERGVSFKAYPCGGLAHPAIDAVLALRSEGDMTAAGVERIEVQVTPYVATRIIYGIPETELEAKFSMPYLVARALCDGGVSVDSFTDEAIADRAVLALAERVHMSVNPALAQSAAGGRPCRVQIHLRDGRVAARQVDFARGSTQAPLSEAELEQKFMGCARRAIGDDATVEALGLLRALGELESLDRLEALLMGGS